MNHLRLCLEQHKVYLITSVLSCSFRMLLYPTCLNWPCAISALGTSRTLQVFHAMHVSPTQCTLMLLFMYLSRNRVRF